MNTEVRKGIPALQRRTGDQTAVFLDGPAGTQLPEYVIDVMANYYRMSNANTHGAFQTSVETDQIIHTARAETAVFLGAEGPANISFGQNMTTLNFSLAHSIGRILMPGDEILITQLDHEANRGPWLMLREKGIHVREVKILPDGTLDYEDMKNKLGDRTRLLAMGMASNLTGAVNDVKLARRLTYETGTWLLLDGVHYAPHFPIDVEEIGCDFLLCSAYKFYGPHVGILYAKSGLLDQLPLDRLRTAGQQAPYSIETGTLNHAAIAGVNGAIRYLASFSDQADLREQLKDSMNLIASYEAKLISLLYDGLLATKKANIVGPPVGAGLRAPTLSFTWDGISASELCRQLAAKNIYAWDGHFYAVRVIEVLGLLEKGGVTRMGVSAYTNEEDIHRTIEVLRQF